jgi:hypothetical protein
MAITQILARVNSETTVAAASSEDALEAILALQLGDAEAFCDFGWTPRLIELAVRFGAPEKLLFAVKRAFEGESLLNPMFPEGSSCQYVYSEISFNGVEAVYLLASELVALPLAEISQTKRQVEKILMESELPTDYETCVRNHVEMLVAFYEEAARRQQVVVTWWD